MYYNMSEENYGEITPSSLKKKELEMRENSWNEHHETVLRQWGEASACYRYMNHNAYLMYRVLSMRFTLPVIVLSTITGTANFAQDQFPLSIRGAVPSIIGGFNLIAGIIATVMQFLKINELMENHKTATLAYGLLSRNIRLCLALPRKERSADGLDFVNLCKAEYYRLIEQSPSIPTDVLKKFEKKYPIDGKFTKPEILNVVPIPRMRMDTTLVKRINPVKALTQGGPFRKIGDLMEAKEEYELAMEKSIKDQEDIFEEDEEGEDDELKSQPGDEIDVEQGKSE